MLCSNTYKDDKAGGKGAGIVKYEVGVQEGASGRGSVVNHWRLFWRKHCSS